MNTRLNSRQAFDRLTTGNARFVSGNCQAPRMPRSLTHTVIPPGQAPFAIVLTCSDSRVPVEMIFDCEIGDVFVIRVAGNVVEPSQLASIEYACWQLGSRLCLVMGHTDCGAVQAAAGAVLQKQTLPTQSLSALMVHLQPAIHKAASQTHNNCHSTLLNNAIVANVNHSMKEIMRNSPLIHSMVEKEELLVMGAVYDIHSGKVNFETDDNLLPFGHAEKTYSPGTAHTHALGGRK